MCVSLGLYVPLVLFSLALFFFQFGRFILFCVVWFCFILFYFVDVCLHTNERDKKESMDLGGWVFEKELRAGGNNNQSMLYEKNRFSIKK